MKREIGIDILRGLSMVYLVGFWHLLEYTHAIPHYQNDITHRITWITLGIFFFISGYLIGAGKTTLSGRGLGSYYLKRFWRIYPLFLVALAWFTHLRISRPDVSFRAALGYSVFAGPAPPTLWFVAMIIVFYLVAPALLYVSRHRKPSEAFLLNIAVMLAMYWYLMATHRLELRMLVYFSVFFLGVYAGANPWLFAWRKTITALAVLSFLVSYFSHVRSLPMRVVTIVPMIALCSLFVVMLVRNVDLVPGRLRTGVLALSCASYCMYLFHRPIYILANRWYFPSTPWLQVVYLVGVCFPVVILFSYVVQKWYDFVVSRAGLLLAAVLPQRTS